MGSDVKIEGLAEIDRRLRQLPKELVGKAGGPVRKGLRAAAYMVRDEAKSRAPKDTGKLRDNIVARLESNPQKKGASELFKVGVRVKGNAFNPKNAFYWRFIEFGRGPVQLLKARGLFGPVGDRYRFLGRSVSAVQPRPFLTPALVENEQRVSDIFVRETRRAIDQVVKRMAKK